MAQAVLNVRMDPSVKKQFDSLCSELGMNASTAVNIFAKTIIRERRFPFEIRAQEDPFFSCEENLKHLREAKAELDAGKGTIHELIEV